MTYQKISLVIELLRFLLTTNNIIIINNHNTFIDKENQYDTNVRVIKIKGMYLKIFIIKKCIKVYGYHCYENIPFTHQTKTYIDSM